MNHISTHHNTAPSILMPRVCAFLVHICMVWYGIVEFNVPLDTV